jgi:alkylation response protein AidB-like acyl-CoA dehydrogenase
VTDQYSAPVLDLEFMLFDVLHCEQLFASAQFEHVDAEIIRSVLNEGGRFASEVLAPIDAVGDQIGARLEHGRVVSPPGFREAYRAYVDGGWEGLDQPQRYGGQDLPLVLQAAIAEMFNAACHSFSMLPLMGKAAARLLIQHADEALRERIVPKLVSGEWSATIVMTEAHAGSDVGRARTSAVPEGDRGTYQLVGTKSFITFADHDFTEQIVHMVLARTPDAPAGTRGLSLFLVPKYQLNDDGTLGEHNALEVTRVEHKMGIKASPTCVLVFDGATGYRIGEEGGGLKALFAMVNTMRLETALQGVAVAGKATRKAIRYANERPQGGATNAPAVSIIEHPDVRRMLFTMMAKTGGIRGMLMATALNLDLSRVGATEEIRNNALSQAEWLLPVCKAYATDIGFEVANLALQVHGGHGYIVDEGVEQSVRDSRVTSIYEGTNGIQAIDLVSRKLIHDGGIRYQAFATRIRTDLEQYAELQGAGDLIESLHHAVDRLDLVSAAFLESGTAAQREVESGAYPYLTMVGLVSGGWMWLRMAAAARSDSAFDQRQRACAIFYAQHLMPEINVLERRALAGAATIDTVPSEALAEY